MIDLGTLGGSYSEGDGVNTQGQVVGTSYTALGAQDAFLYTNGSMIDLNTLIDPSSGFTLVVAESITDGGMIAGYGFDSTGAEHASLLTLNPMTAVPEPSSLALIGLAGLSLAFRSWRRTPRPAHRASRGGR